MYFTTENKKVVLKDTVVFVSNLNLNSQHCFALSPYLTGMRQLETSSRIVRDYFVTKINGINTTFTLQSH